MAKINYASHSASDKTNLESYLDSQGIKYNPDEDGNSTSIELGMNILYWTVVDPDPEIPDQDVYADCSYLGNIADAWDPDGNPTSWTPDVHIHLASKANLDGFPNKEDYYPNRFAGEQIPVPEDVEINVRTGVWTKTAILGFMQDNLIPHNGSWLKARLISAVLLWYFGSAD